MAFIGIIVGLLIVALILQGLRRVFTWIDWIYYILALGAMFILPIVVWIMESFWAALGVFFISLFSCGFIGWLMGMYKTVTVNHFGDKYTLECSNCQYNDIDIISNEYDYCDYECPRCGTRYRMVYKNDGTGKAFTSKIPSNK